MKKDKKVKQEIVSQKKSKNKLLILLDAHAIIHRAYHALPEFSTQDGEPTGALYGVTAMLLKILKDLKPDYVVACYDLPGGTFRHEAYENYKAGRPKADVALVSQINRSRELLGAFNIPIYDHKGFEADDILGTIVEQTKKDKNLDVIIASGDMDTLQLVSGSKIRVFTLKKGINDTIIYDEAGVLARFGFPPKLIPDYKGLRGDPSDNIIGISGIGEKTATTLITTFGRLEDMYKKLKKDKVSFEKAGLSPRVIEILTQGEEEALFSKTLAEIRRDAPITFTLPEKTIFQGIEHDKVFENLKKFEFKSLESRFRGLFGSGGNEEIQEEPRPSVDTKELEETTLALWVVNSEMTNPTEEDIYTYTREKEFTSAKKKILTELKEKKLEYVYNSIELPILPLVQEMEAQGVLIDLPYLKKLSLDYHATLAGIEKNIYELAGGEFNINSPKQLGEILFDKLNLTAKGLKKTGTGARSTRISELEKLQGSHPIIDKIMEQREIQKLLSTYIDAIPPLISLDGRLHARFIQSGSTTGRFSSTDPNLQNIPIKSELGRNVRKAFVAPEGSVLLALDYSQIELRLAAILSGDTALIKIFKDGSDVHASVASRVFGVSEDKITNEMRRHAKVINFGIIYGMGVNALKEALGTSRAEAETFYRGYFEKFPGITKYLEDVKAFARKHGYTETLFGRRRPFSDIRSPIPYIQASAERMAINAPIQGTAADLIKLALLHNHEALAKENLLPDARLILQIHDELIYEVKKDILPNVKKLLIETMEGVLDVTKKNAEKVPILVSTGVGATWDDLK